MINCWNTTYWFSLPVRKPRTSVTHPGSRWRQGLLPAIIAAVIGLHLLVIVKQKHTQPGYARKLAEPGKVLGVPLVPYQALLAGQLLFLMFGALFLLSAFVSPHPLEDFGPPQAASPVVKPDWYLLWIYGFLKIVPGDVSFRFLGATIGPDFIGGLLFPALLFGVLTLAPWMDRTNRRVVRRYEYLDPMRQSPIRTAAGVAVLTFLGTLFIAAYYDQLDMSLREIWTIVIAVPIGVGILTALFLSIPNTRPRFDPQESLEPSMIGPSMTPGPIQAPLSPEPEAQDGRVTAPPETEPDTIDVAPVQSEDSVRLATIASRGGRARDHMVATLHEMGELAPLVRQLDNDNELMEVLNYIESLRATLADSNDTLQGVVRAHQDDADTWDTGAKS